jgi:hypothetical protein
MRRAAHIFIGVASWAAFLTLWWMLVRDGRVPAAALRSTAVELGAVAGLVLAVTGWWVRHNIAIYRRKGPRTGVTSAPARTDRDTLGRPVRWEFGGRKGDDVRAPHVVVDVVAGEKTYRPGG